MAIKRIMDEAKEWLGFARNVKAPPEVRVKFLLTYDDLLMGTLSVKNGVWTFEYSEDFRRSGELRPLVEFPDVEKTYVNEELWQFFASRIPSPEQAEVGEILKREHIEEDDAVSLLRRFGKRTVANPFELTLAA
ncbi:MAG: HipA N-terminal domain-containing protein [Acidobacteriota bacterium]|nr:HipA N-terminal domain-containing protein [Acidobacteriota bacterium]